VPVAQAVVTVRLGPTAWNSWAMWKAGMLGKAEGIVKGLTLPQPACRSVCKPSSTRSRPPMEVPKHTPLRSEGGEAAVSPAFSAALRAAMRESCEARDMRRASLAGMKSSMRRSDTSPAIWHGRAEASN
jgi:hypothetical protein